MKKFLFLIGVVFLANAANLFGQDAYKTGDYRNGIDWKEPPIVTPGEKACCAPSDAIVLFDGTNLEAWNGGKWEVANGELTVVPQSGDIRTKQKFGSCQIHLEFATPPAEGTGQQRGNSGLFLMDHYEVQILDNFQNQTYFDGQCGSIYKQIPPYANACKAPGEWQTYEVIFTRPILKIEDNVVVEVIRPATVTVIQNGVVVLNNYEIKGDTFWHRPPQYQPHADKESLRLQDHRNQMKFRNIWVREIPDSNVIPVPTVMPYYNDPAFGEMGKTVKKDAPKKDAPQKEAAPKKDAPKKDDVKKDTSPAESAK